MKKPFLFAFILIALTINHLSAQKTITEDEQTWFAVFNQTRFTDKWGLWADSHFRLKNDFVKDPSLFLIRVGPTYYVNDDVRLTAAYCFANIFPEEGHKNISQPEHRPFQQIQWFTKLPFGKLMQWVRLEERFRRKIKNDNELADGYNFNWRTRCNFALFVPLSKKGFAPGSFQFLLNDELMVNFGKNIVYNYFDQNRLFGGFVYQISKESLVQLGYMNVFQQQSAGNKYKSIHTLRLFYSHNFDFRQKAETK